MVLYLVCKHHHCVHLENGNAGDSDIGSVVLRRGRRKFAIHDWLPYPLPHSTPYQRLRRARCCMNKPYFVSTVGVSTRGPGLEIHDL